MSFPIRINLVDCSQCGMCESACLYNAIYMDEFPVIQTEKCQLCKNCIEACPAGLISLREELRTVRTYFPELPHSFPTHGIWVVAECRKGVINPVTYELLGAACQLANQQPQQVCALVMGADCNGAEDRLIAAGADCIYIAEHPALEHLIEERYTDVLVTMVRRYHPNILLIGATHFGRGLSARAAALLNTGLTADCTQLQIDPDSGNLLQIRPAFGGNLMATIETPHHRPQMASVRPGVMKALEPDHKRKGEIIYCDLKDLSIDNRVELLAEQLSDTDFSIAEMPVLVAGGRGMQKQENISLLYELAETLGGSVAASRAAVEAGWLPFDCQVGQTGKTVAPRLYIACGISGQIQHTAAITGADRIIAINNDPEAAIFRYADYGIVGDVTEVIPALIELFNAK